MFFAAAATLLAVALVAPQASARIREGDCEVCLKTMQKFIDASKAAKAKKPAQIEAVIEKQCAKFKDSKEIRLCYYIGGTSDAATRMLGEVAKPISHFLPAKKICEKLKKKDAQICQLTYEKPIDLEGKDLSKMRVKELKNILNKWGEKCNGCTEKRDYVKLVEKLKPKYAAKPQSDEL
eukprot:CAMPEP_0114522580 /NCGR_PEP_ID=MMETSP0109-20121206/20812_1 /TAXON_ID=29199 /ORGANISM="Chlorarachnion reptans, Strain CCCM449" /LENGTH=178 /DNA_ID=CAMNT_0001703795 /DNA_START=90 /DNA_END=626 /DNA_ORIENTATION=-